MQEIVLILSSLVGVATAAAVRKMPRDKTQLLSIGASSHIKSQINSLKIEKDILTKTISRLYQSDSELSKIQKDKLLLKYQHQLGVVLAKLEKLDQASKHPDLGPVGDGLITLMDQKLSKLDDRLYELSSKIASKDIADPVDNIESSVKKHEDKAEPTKNTFSFEKEKIEPVEYITKKPRDSFELTTLTNISRKEPKFSLFEEEKQEIKPMPKPRVIQTETIKPKEKIIEETVQPKTIVKDKIEIAQSTISRSDISLQEITPDIKKEVAKITEHKALPEPKQPKTTKLNDDDDFDDDSDDLDKIKGNIMKVLSKLDQAEVE